MNEQEFKNIIKKSDYHFFVFSCPACIPFQMAVHTWIVVVSPEGITRRDLGHFKNKRNPAFGYLHKDFLLPWE